MDVNQTIQQHYTRSDLGNVILDALEQAKFTIVSWSDTTDAARAWFVSLADGIRSEGLPPLGFHVLLGADFPIMAQNQGRNLKEGRIALAQVLAAT